MADQPFMTDIQTLRARARQHIEQGAVTQGYSADRDTVIRLLQEALATEIICVLRYKRHYFMASGINAQSVAQEFLQHATEEQMHADQIAQRIVQLGGAPNFSPEGLSTRSHSEYIEGESLLDMIKEDLVDKISCSVPISLLRPRPGLFENFITNWEVPTCSGGSLMNSSSN